MLIKQDKRWLLPIVLITGITLFIYAVFFISDFHNGRKTDTYQVTVEQQNEVTLPDDEEAPSLDDTSSPSAEKVVPSDGNYIASKKGEKYHTRDCSSAANIQEENLIYFASAEEAAASGYEPCGVCNPDE